MGFTDFVRRYELARSEGLVLRYLSDAYRTLRQTVPDAHRTPDLETIIEWLGETIRQTDSSLHRRVGGAQPPRPGCPRHHVGRAAAAAAAAVGSRSGCFTAMVRNAMFARVNACARDDLDALMRLERAAADRFEPPREVVMTRSRWDEALEDYYARARDASATDGDARGPAYFWIGPEESGEPAGRPGGYDGPVAAGPTDAGRPGRPPRLGDRGGRRPRRHRRGGRAGAGGDRCRSLTGAAVDEPVHAGP